MWRGVRLEATGTPPEQRGRPVLVAPEVVRVASAELGEALEELGFAGALRLLPARLPRLVSGKELLGVQVSRPQAMVLLDRQRIVVLEVKPVLCLVRERTSELVLRALGLGWSVRISRPVGLRRRRSDRHD